MRSSSLLTVMGWSSWLMRFVDRGRAEDAVQEALTRVYQRWSRVTDPLAYARRTAINATRDDWRRLLRADRAYRELARFGSTDGEDLQERLVTNSGLIDALVKSQTARALARMRELLTRDEPASYEMEIA
jgi:DNA-directed RNA polymerase specialized sigma24 family protein